MGRPSQICRVGGYFTSVGSSRVGKAVSVGIGVRSIVNGPEVGVNVGVSLPAGTGVDVGSTVAVDNRPGDND